ncbi:MAG: hypothetical protein D6707_10225 [Bacteroidetes bacterium]|nr:MAG: hypothetical protein D6707_10225 [Bacteroidota bacterium]
MDVMFANEDEARTLTGAEPEDALHILSGKTELSVVKLGAHGSLVKQGNRFEKIAPRKAKAVDTTGAGDIFASGFIFGLTRYNDLQKAGEIGSVLGGKVVEVIGAKLNDNHWKEIKKAIDLP